MKRNLLIAAVAASLTAAFAPATAFAATANDITQFNVTGGALSFSPAPDVPTLTSVTINGSAQTTNSTMASFGIQDATGTGNGWNVTVNGDASGGKSAAFKQYCPNTTCGTDSGPGYVAGGATLAADSLTLDSTGTSFTSSGGGTAPTLQCSSGCAVDHATAVKVASAAVGAGIGTWTTGTFSGTSLALATPSTLAALQASESYRLDLIWTLGTGP